MTSPGNQKDPNRRIVFGVCLFLIAITWLVFGQTVGYESIYLDDPAYVFKNADVNKGLSLHGIVWAFGHSVSGNWHPLTVITHMLDCQIYSLRPGGHHFTNVVMHTIAAILLFLVLKDMTVGAGALPNERSSARDACQTDHIWRCAFVATIFAIHPLRVESVAWIAERKDVLSGIFFMLSLAAYLRYVRKPSFGNYSIVVLTFACGLMSKPMLVTLPFVLLLLDYWPLGRFTAQKSTVIRLIWEKIPLLLLTAIACSITLVVQKKGLSSIDVIPFWVRLLNAAVSLVSYIWQMFWPAKLALFYPFPSGTLSAPKLGLAILTVGVVTYLAWRTRRQRPYFLTGWFWYVGMLVPVIGLVQVGGQTRADRYTYLPQIGLYLAATWAAADLTASWRYRRQILCTVAVVAIAALTWCARIQTSYWKNNESIWSRTLAVTSDNAIAHLSLAHVFFENRQFDSAILHFQESLKIFSRSRLYGSSAALAYDGLGNALVAKGLGTGAISHYRKALQLKPDYAAAEFDLALELFREGNTDEAIDHWQRALSINPRMANAYSGIGDARLRQHLTGDAIVCYEKALQVAPQSLPALNALAWVLATSSDRQFRNGARAIQLAQRADQLSGGKNATCLRTLAAAYAETGQFEEAIHTAERALELAKSDPSLADQLQTDIGFYRMNFPLR